MARCKLSVIAQATAEFSQTVDPEVLQPYSTHFHPETLYNVSLETRSNALDPRRMGAPQHVVTALPALEPVRIQWWIKKPALLTSPQRKF